MKIININKDWEFEKEGVKSVVSLPHTWNGIDGQNGEHGYFQGKCVYRKNLDKANGVCYIEFNGANSVTEVFINNNKVGTHKGGYSMFRFRIDGYLTQDKNLLEVFVDNTIVPEVFPTSADTERASQYFAPVGQFYIEKLRALYLFEVFEAEGHFPYPVRDGRVFHNLSYPVFHFIYLVRSFCMSIAALSAASL